MNQPQAAALAVTVWLVLFLFSNVSHFRSKVFQISLAPRAQPPLHYSPLKNVLPAPMAAWYHGCIVCLFSWSVPWL